jgi:hypothetical protein
MARRVGAPTSRGDSAKKLYVVFGANRLPQRSGWQTQHGTVGGQDGVIRVAAPALPTAST